jgi:hypothetical protein
MSLFHTSIHTKMSFMGSTNPLGNWNFYGDRYNTCCQATIEGTYEGDRLIVRIDKCYLHKDEQES